MSTPGERQLFHDSVLGMMPDMVIVDSESPGRDTLEHLAKVHERSPRLVVIFAESDEPQPMRQALAAGVSACVLAGLQPERLAPVLTVAIARFEQDRAMHARLGLALTELPERKLGERAKGLLLKEFGLDEPQAHTHLRKLAMDRGQRLGEVAERPIEAHQLLQPPA